MGNGGIATQKVYILFFIQLGSKAPFKMLFFCEIEFPFHFLARPTLRCVIFLIFRIKYCLVKKCFWDELFFIKFAIKQFLLLVKLNLVLLPKKKEF